MSGGHGIGQWAQARAAVMGEASAGPARAIRAIVSEYAEGVVLEQEAPENQPGPTECARRTAPFTMPCSR